jgi:hypothetical protein
MKYESLITYHSKDMAMLKFFADRRTDQKLYAPDLSIRGHNKRKRKTTTTKEINQLLKA